MPKVRITREDMSMGKILPPGKYRIKIRNITVEPTKKGDSDNYVGDYVVVAGEYSGTPLKNWMNEKKGQPGIKLLGRLFEASGYREGKDKDDFFETLPETEKIVGREVYAVIVNQLYEGNMQNRIEDFLPAEKSATA
jgi:hypothetical protein